MRTPQQIIDRYKAGIAGAGQAYQDGIRSVTVNPAQIAIAAAPKYEQKIMESIADKRYQAGLADVTLQGWQAASVAGATKLTQSSGTAAAKFGTYMSQAAPIIAAIQQEVRAMPDVTEADADARMLANKNLMKTRLRGIKGRGRR